MGSPSIFPTGVTIYKPEKCFNGYTLFPACEAGALLVDMNGTEVKLWDKLKGFPNKLLPGGQVFGSRSQRNDKYGYQDMTDLIQVDWDGNIVWEYNKHEFIEDPGEVPQWMARQHHDYQREGNPVGYYVPDMECKTTEGNTLILVHENIVNKKISDKRLCDDVFLEVDWDGNVVWEWHANEHFKEIGFNEIQKNVLARDPNMHQCDGGVGDWLHINCMSPLGPNKWYDKGDERFHPDNIIFDSREANFLAIISKESGKIVWKIGPDYSQTKELKEMGEIIGPHMAHMIPQGLPGAGNILVFDNGGWAGYGLASTNSEVGLKVTHRDYSRVLEINPVTLQVVWQYNPRTAGLVMPFNSNHLYSPLISGAQRLPNGNTFITIGMDGRMIEVTRMGELVWEYISPYFFRSMPSLNEVYRAYRYPYAYVPQLEKPEEVAIAPIDITTFRVPGASPKGAKMITSVPGAADYPEEATNSFCVQAEDE
ncbi:MAG: aryl-sulfate sulfotransferase [Peptococcaceae bacterium]|nr:aryl-sulfate sulfotransferase [Peptococcaceae bacterium]